MEKYLINKPGKHEIRLQLKKEGEIFKWLGVIEARESGEYELDLVLTHLVPGTYGRIEIIGLAENGARVRVKGLIKIEKEAQETDSFLSMKFLLIDKKSIVTVEPELEIEANRVKASHSASVGKIDQEQLMYLESRGVCREEAKDIIVKGFINGIDLK